METTLINQSVILRKRIDRIREIALKYGAELNEKQYNRALNLLSEAWAAYLKRVKPDLTGQLIQMMANDLEFV